MYVFTCCLLTGSPNKRCKQEADSPSPESPKKPPKRRKLSASKKKIERTETVNNYNSQPSATSMVIPNVARNDTHTIPPLLKDFPMKVPPCSSQLQLSHCFYLFFCRISITSLLMVCPGPLSPDLTL